MNSLQILQGYFLETQLLIRTLNLSDCLGFFLEELCPTVLDLKKMSFQCYSFQYMVCYGYI